jgi:GT2 family glycosyltransferase
MSISVITPSLRQSDWLKLCVASVADQGVSAQHIVQDAGSDDGTLGWLLQDDRVCASVERDSGMYDAINRGLRKASGDILSYLNCDEQYLPGILPKVQAYFRDHLDVDVLFTDSIVVNDSGEYICHRKASKPTLLHTLVSGNLSVLTCGCFFRREILDRHGLYFDSSFRVLGDAEWISRMIRSGVRVAVMRAFTSVFTKTGLNLSLSPQASDERQKLQLHAPAWARLAKPLVILAYRAKKALAGHYLQAPFEYSVFTRSSPCTRMSFSVRKPTHRWVP